jgi:hypothetical protein
METYLSDIGITLNIAGTLLIAFAFGKFPKEFGGSTTGTDGKEYNFSYLLHPLWFKFGVGILILGFFLQLSFVKGLLA